MKQSIPSHLTIDGTPLCKVPLGILADDHPNLLLVTCGHRSFYRAQQVARSAKHWAVRAVKGECPADLHERRERA
jgi:hypothetical protein